MSKWNKTSVRDFYLLCIILYTKSLYQIPDRAISIARSSLTISDHFYYLDWKSVWCLIIALEKLLMVLSGLPVLEAYQNFTPQNRIHIHEYIVYPLPLLSFPPLEKCKDNSNQHRCYSVSHHGSRDAVHSPTICGSFEFWGGSTQLPQKPESLRHWRCWIWRLWIWRQERTWWQWRLAMRPSLFH